MTLFRKLGLAALTVGLLSGQALADGDDASEPTKAKVTTEAILGHTMVIDGGTVQVTLLENGQTNFQDAAADAAEPEETTSGRWWVDPTGRICLVYKGPWKGGVCGDFYINEDGAPIGVKFDGHEMQSVEFK